MPVITIDIERFSKLMGREVSVNELVEKIPLIGVDIEEVGSNYVRIEYNPNRPDLGNIIGVVRAYKGILREEIGIKKYKLKRGGFEVKVDGKVREVRPFIACAVVTNVPMDEELLQELITYQEDLHEGIGRGRRKVAIGIHNLDVIEFPLKYLVVERDSFKFQPLNESKEMSIREILNELETGRKYGYILPKSKYPMIIDAQQRVLSFPPIINAELTRVTTRSRNLFIDVTGTEHKPVIDTVNLLTTYLHDCGCEVWEVKIIYPSQVSRTPNFKEREMKVSKELICELIGLELRDEEIIDCLKACRLDAEMIEDGVYKVIIPPYRVDIMHPVDLVEEVVIGYGYDNLEPMKPEVNQYGKRDPRVEFSAMLSEILIGLGLQEVMTFTLSSLEAQFLKMNLKPSNYIKLKKPKSREFEVIRLWIIPGLLRVLAHGQKEKHPIMIFEVGKVAKCIGGEPLEEEHLAIAIHHSRAGYSDVKAVLDRLMSELELNYFVREAIHNSFIEGRVGEVSVEGEVIGLIGEIHPSVLEKFSLENPTSVLEINVDKLFEIYRRRHLEI